MTRFKRMTIREIARLAGVSPATVSLAINNKAGVNEETRKRVMEVVGYNNYIPHARRLIDRHTGNIAVIMQRSLKEISEVFQTELYKNIIVACENQGYNAVFTALREVNGRLSLPDVLRGKLVDGIIFLGDLDESTLDLLLSCGLPFVLLDSNQYLDNPPSVYIDYRHAAYTATMYLLGLGHRDIAYIGNDYQHQFNMTVFAGYQQALQERSGVISVSRIQMNVYDAETVNAAIKSLFAAGQSAPTAVFCATDLHAIYALNSLAAMGIRVPQDVSVIGVDDLLLSAVVSPPLTTIRINRVEIARMGVDLLLEAMDGGRAQSVVLPSNELVIRGSTAPMQGMNRSTAVN